MVIVKIIFISYYREIQIGMKLLRRSYLLIIIFIILTIYVYPQIIQISKSYPFHGDEYHFINRSITVEYFWKRKFDNPFWQGDTTIGPRLPEYLYGITIFLSTRNSIIDYLKSVGFTKDNLCCSKLDGWQLDISRELGGDINNLSPQQRLRIQPLQYARRINVILIILMFYMILLISTVTIGIFAGLLSIYLIFNNPLFPLLLRAMGDGPLAFFLILNLFLSLLYIYSLKRSIVLRNTLFILTSISGGLSLSSKIMNGGISILFFALLLILINTVLYKKLWLGFQKAFIACLISVFVFYLLHPYLWRFPVQEFINTIRFYNLVVSKSMQLFFPYDKLLNISQKTSAVYMETFAVGSKYGNFSNISFFQKIPIDLILFIIGFGLLIYDTLKYLVRKNVYKLALALWISVIILTITINLPLKWDRYFLPIVIAAVFVQTYTLTRIGVLLLRLILKYFELFWTSYKPKQKIYTNTGKKNRIN